ncbi:hypothetical protein BH09PSE4_BH09PSE4_21200 [soil metagenome]
MNAPARKPQFDPGTAHRRGLIAKVHIAKTQLGLDEDDYRAVLLRVAGRMSAKDCTVAELEEVVAEFSRQGFTAKAKTGVRHADHPSALKARALWISLHQLGVVQNPSEQALEVFACRQCGVARFHCFDHARAYKLTEALKAMADRAGWSQDLTGVKPEMTVRVLKRRLVEALFGKLRDAGFIAQGWNIQRAAREFGGIELDGFYITGTTQEYELIATAFARTLREKVGGLAYQVVS